MFNFLKTLFGKPKLETLQETPKPMPSMESRYSESRQETLAGGFVYIYPVYSNGSWLFELNIDKAAIFSMKLDEVTRHQLCKQVMEREGKFHQEASHARIDEIISDLGYRNTPTTI